MSTWNSTWPNGSQSVKQNRSPGQQNTAYIETQQNKDHFWNIGVNEDGHHKFAQMPAFESGGTPINPTLATGMDGVIYNREQIVGNEIYSETQAFLKNNTSVMQLLGIRAYICFNLVGLVPTALSKFNVSTITRSGAGLYNITFGTALPSANYLVLGGGAYGTGAGSDPSNSIIVSVQGGATLATTKQSTVVAINTRVVNENLSPSSELVDPVQAWVLIFGG